MISFAGIPLLTPTREWDAWGREHIDPSWVPEYAERTWPGRAPTHAAFRGQLPQGPIEPGTLTWPAGASRFAVGHFLASEDELVAVREVAYAGNTNTPLDLVVADGTGSVTASMFLLSARPRARVPGGEAEARWLLTLVDQRYYWWFSAGQFAVVAGTTTWANLYTMIAGALEIEIDADDVDPAYLKPPVDFGSNYDPLPLLLDAVAFSVGQRIVVERDGTVRAMSAESSQTIMTSNLDLGDLSAGGELALTP